MTTWRTEMQLRLRDRLFQVPNIPAVEDMKYEGRSFKRPIDKVYLEERIISTFSQVEAYGRGPMITDSWIYSLNVFFPFGRTLTEIDDLCVGIVDAFPPGWSFDGFDSVFHGSVTNTELGSTIEDEGYALRMINVYFFTRRLAAA